MIPLEETVIQSLKASHQVLTTIESCTGGLIAHLLTNVSGASEIYWGSRVVYDNTAKEALGVPHALLLRYGAVSKEIASELAELGLKNLQTTLASTPSISLLKPRGLICLATTGIAGPSGGTEEKPVGLCFIGIASSGKPTWVEEYHSPQTGSQINRIASKLNFAQKALEILLRHL